MKNQNNNKGVIILLIVIVTILLGLCILFATGTINLSSNSDTQNQSTEIDSSILNNLYSIIGIVSNEPNSKNNCLNMYISSNDYKENANKIFSWYAYTHNLETYHYNDSKCQADVNCLIAYSAATSRTILKEDANKIIKLYNFETIDFLNPLSSYDNEYSYNTQIGDPPSCDYSIRHDTNSKYLNLTDIRIIDNQDIIEYEFGSDQIKTTIKQTVTYDFTKNNDGDYYLANVIVG